jgi:dynactin complex subunit
MLQGIGAVLGGFAAVLIGIYTVVTRPLQNSMKSEISASDGRMVALVTGAVTASETRMNERMTALEIRLTERLTTMETRLNERIETRIVRG